MPQIHKEKISQVDVSTDNSLFHWTSLVNPLFLAEQAEVHEGTFVQGDFASVALDDQKFYLHKDHLIAVLPYLRTEKAVFLQIEEIGELNDYEGVLAIMAGIERHSGARIEFLCDDYLENKRLYLTDGFMEINLIGWLESFELIKPNPKNDQSPAFVSYFPSETGGVEELDDLVIIGEIDHCIPIAILGFEGYLLTVTLLKTNEEILQIDMFLSLSNVPEDLMMREGLIFKGICRLSGGIIR
jgi:hypothetical protein